MFEEILRYFQGSQFMAHGYCLRWDPALLLTLIIGNSIIAFAYFSIPAALFTFVGKRKDLAFSWIFVLFGIFIVSCGSTHLMKILTLYKPLYWAEAGLDLFTGIISLITAILLWPLLPRVLELPSPKQLRQKNQLLEESMQESRNLNAELKDLNQQLSVARDRAIEASNAKSAFVAAISHELRTPLTAILGMNEMLAASKLKPEQLQLSQSVQAAAKSLLLSVNDILDLSRLEAGKLEIDEEPFYLSELLSSCIKNVESAASRKHLALVVNSDPQLPSCLSGDEGRLRQILTNLLSNAVKFTERGQVELAVLLISQKESGRYKLRFSVTDTGMGVSKSDLERIFLPFTQADQSTARRFGGSGLGLSIAHYLAMLMDSHIQVESSLGQGSRFWFDISMGEASILPGLKNSAQQLLPLPQGAHILVVDDDPFLQKLAAMQLSNLKLKVSTVGSATEVYELFDSGVKFDLILMDCHMPGEDGYSLTRSLRGRGLNNLPIIAVTAGAMKGDRERCVAAGMDDYLSKPYTIRQLSETLAKWLPVEPFQENAASGDPHKRPLLNLEKLSKTYGRQESLEIVEIFFQSAGPIIDELFDSRQNQDAVKIKFLAHKLKGASAMVCIEQMARTSHSLEESALSCNWTEVDAALAKLKLLFEQAKSAGSPANPSLKA